MEVFKKLKEMREKDVCRKTVEFLNRGYMYPVFKFVQRKPDFMDRKTGEILKNLTTYFTDKFNSKFYLIMPTLYKNLSPEEVDKRTVAEGEKIHFLYYGKEGGRNEVDLLNKGEEVDCDKLRYIKLEEEAAAKKRKFDGDSEAGGSGLKLSL